MIGVLNAYHFDLTPGNYQEEYLPMIEAYLKKTFPAEEIKNYNVAQGEWPKDVHECRGWFVSGSACSCYENIPWISQLISFIQECDSQKAKVVGICFGHQLIAHALGGKVEKSPKGWGIGVRSFEITHYLNFMQPQLKNNQCSLLFSHQDQVMELPKGAKRLGTDEFCENQMYSIGEHIFCLQGHPEFNREFAQKRYLTRTEVIGSETVKKALATMQQSTDEDILSQWFNHFMA